MKTIARCVSVSLGLALAALVVGGAIALAASPEEPRTEAATGVTNTTAELHGLVNPTSPSIVSWFFEYAPGSSCTGLGAGATTPQPATGAEEVQERPAEAILTGLQPNTQYTFCLVSENDAKETTLGNELSFTTTAAVPAVAEASTLTVGQSEASVRAEIDAQGIPASFWVRYGTSEAYESETSHVSLGASAGAVPVSAGLTKLLPGRTYHFRFFAESALGQDAGQDVSFTTPDATGTAPALPDERVYELVSGAAGVEVYSPVAPISLLQDAVTNRPFQASVGGDSVAYVAEPAPTGGNGEIGGGLGNQWLATRSATGWSQSDVSQPVVGAKATSVYEGFSPDLSAGFLTDSAQPPLTSDAPANCQVLYERASTTGAFRAGFSTVKTPGECGHPHLVGYSADRSQFFFQTEAALTGESEPAEESTSHEQHSEFGPGEGAPCQFSCNLYVSAGSELRQVNILPNGQAVPNATFGGASLNPPDFSNAISADGSRVFWTDTKPGADMDHVYLRENADRPQSPLGATGECVVPADACTVPVTLGAGKYWTATPDGRYAYYTENEQLWRFDTQTLTRTLLVDRDFAKGEEVGVQGIVGINQTGEDGAYLYFVAPGVLTAGANAEGVKPAPFDTSGEGTLSEDGTEVSGVSSTSGSFEPGQIITGTGIPAGTSIIRVEGEGRTLVLSNRATVSGPASLHAGQPNLYVLHDGATSFIATLTATDNEINGNSVSSHQNAHQGDWAPDLGSRTAELTPDGRNVIFESTRSLTGYNNIATPSGAPVLEAFAYSSDAARLLCVSCQPTGAPPRSGGEGKGETPTLLPITFNDTRVRRLISADGSRVFFSTFQSLAPQDSNGVQDVYEWEREGTPTCPATVPARRDGGCDFLLSGGESSDYSFLVDADPAGENVFFTTRARLVTQDRDEHVDLYDARVHGGFPESSLACTGTGCQGVPPAPPTFATPSSATFNGLGNFLPQPLAKGNPPEKKTAQQIRAARLAKALRACHRLKKRRLRSNCERSARRRYGPAHKIKPSAHRGKKGHKP